MKTPWQASGCAGIAMIAMMTVGLQSSTSASPLTQAVYTDSLQNGWQGWGWATLNYSSPTPTHSGASAIQVKIDGTAQALYLHHDSFGVDTGNLSFWIDGGDAGGQLLQVALLEDGKARPAIPLPPLQAKTWNCITLPFSRLGVENSAAVNGIWIQDRAGHAQPAFFVDDISLKMDKPYIPAPPTQIHAAALTIDASHSVNTIDDRMFGLNTAVWDSKLSDDSSVRLLRAAGIRALRFPGGSTSDDYDWSTGKVTSGKQWQTNIGIFSKVAEAIKATVYITVNYGTGTPEMAAAWVAYANGSASDKRPLGTDSLGRNWRTVGYWAALRGAAPQPLDDGRNFLRARHPKPYGFRYWEIGNECYGNWEADNHGVPGSKPALAGKPHDGYTYGKAAARYLKQMRNVDPNIRIGIPAGGGWDDAPVNPDAPAIRDAADGKVHTGFMPVTLATLHAAGVLPDFMVMHRYVAMDGSHQSDTDLLESGSAGWTSDEAFVRKMIDDYIGDTAGRRIELDCTETNSGSQGSKEGTSLTNGLFLADTIATMMKTELKSCIWWDFRNGATGEDNNPERYGWRSWGDDGMVSTGSRKDSPLNTPYPPYYAERLLSRWARGGDVMVDAKSNRPEIAVYAVRRTSGELSLLVINKQEIADVKATINLLGYGPVQSQAQAYRFGKLEDRNRADLTGLTYNGVSPAWTAVFPAYSMTVISLKRRHV